MSRGAAVLTYGDLESAVASAAAFRCRRTLEPAGGPGDKVFPPTYSGAVYAIEQRRVPGRDEPVTCVLLDSVQSQANRMEEALQEAIDAGEISMPLVVVDFSAAKLPEPLGRITLLQVPHRVTDAILRDSELGGKPFRESPAGSRIGSASLANATPIYEVGTPSLLFGVWDSAGPKGGLGTKFERAIVSEVTAIDALPGTKPSSRLDPLRIQKDAGPVYARKGSNGRDWVLDPAHAEKDAKGELKLYGGNSEAKKRGNPAALNHGNVTPSLSKVEDDVPLAGGITCASIEQTTTLSLIQLRRLRFPKVSSEGAAAEPATAERNVAAQAVLAAMGLCAATLAFGPGMDLRSRCVLFPQSPMEWDLLDVPGQPAKRFSLDRAAAIKLFKDAVDAAKKLGLPWNTTPVTLTPGAQLIELVRKSQELAIRDPDAA